MSTFSPTVMNWGGGSLIKAHLGPTNTGKTHRAIGRMLQHPSGMIGLPLRLLAQEVYSVIVSKAGVDKVALLTGEQRIVPAKAVYWVCTVESMPVEKAVHFVAIDEIQLAAHHKRGHFFTDRILNLRGLKETWFLGSDTMVSMIRRLTPTVEMHHHERLSSLSWAPPKRIGALPKRSAVIAFSAKAVYDIAEQLRIRKGGAAVVLGALSPKARNAQVALFESGEVDHLVATDAIGMGLNLNIRSVYFSSLRKYDGKHYRKLASWELGQIAGRAGRYNQDGFFGLLKDCEDSLSTESIEAIATQSFPSVPRLKFRNSNLSFDSAEDLIASLNQRPPKGGLDMTLEQRDELALDALLADSDIGPVVKSSAIRLKRLWGICQIPDYRQDSVAKHHQFLAVLARQLLVKDEMLNSNWLIGRLDRLDRFDGSLDHLLRRIAHIRSWSYIVNRPEWVSPEKEWTVICRQIEDRLSDALHQRLTSEFVNSPGGMSVGFAQATGLMMEGSDLLSDQGVLGQLSGFSFRADPSAVNRFGLKQLLKQSRGLMREHAQSVVESHMRDEKANFELNKGQITLSNQVVAYANKGPTLIRPKLKTMPMDLLENSMRRTLFASAEKWLFDQVKTLLMSCQTSSSSLAIKGLCFQLQRSLGVCLKQELSQQLKSLSRKDRKEMGKRRIRIGYKYVYAMPLLKPHMQALKFLMLHAWLGETTAISELPKERVLMRVNWSPAFALGMGYPKVGSFCIRVDMFERVSALLRATLRGNTQAVPTQPMQWLGCTQKEWKELLNAMGYTSTNGVLRKKNNRRARKRRG